MKKTLIYTAALLTVLGSSTSCNDFLDCEPITSVSTTAYLFADNDLGAYAANFYSLLPSHGTGYSGLGLFDDDNGTDNQTAATPSTIFVPGQSYVGNFTHWSNTFTNLRQANYFLTTVIPRYENGEISGNESNIRHYIGEMYFFRALIYFSALQSLGDFPILKENPSDNYEALREASKRRPRNEVARFIIEDLDNAYNMMLATPPMTNRLTRDCAALLKSRVALFEGTWEKYHKNTAFVPGGPGWPGAEMDYLKDFTINIDSEIEYFLDQAVKAADLVASAHQLHSDYAALFNSVDLSGIDEILLWRVYSTDSDINVTHRVVDYLQRNGSGNTGYTRSMVDSYLMANGLPIYASGSDYAGDDTYENLFAGRDPRMGQTILKTGDLLSDRPNLVDYIKHDGYGYFYRAPIFVGLVENANPTGYCLRKGLNTSGDMQTTKVSYTGCPTYRAAEAYLNYIEAYYELNGNLGGNCDKYWKALRTRAGVNTDYNATISQTVMSKEAADWGSYSAGVQVNPTLYNIRRERRIELVSEGFRFADLKRWRALDQVKNVHIQGFNFWDEMYKMYTDPTPEEATEESLTALGKITLIENTPGASGTPNISAKSDPYADGKYLLPYRKNSANLGYNGLTWNQAKYLYPIRNTEFRLTTAVEGSNDYDTSTIYQNPGWSKEDGTLPEGD
ncbi:RagB/SusD family nutrient uptake outer membrane protein [uncultured Alistipes sp.]|uniref:RagB/SusD family nutrient uptake outer membrane protein n=1 Tax=uncultured Alistipes sp. TaxID=538949 RepID=UPI002639764C|nr:RagB/SusD family nutrient uptake outer membrane protein [uncultured Alistipes sp.]